jgi:ABC-type lipoprotein export system ATPase subunit
MLEDACVEIEVLTEKDRLEKAQKYARRNRMRYIDQLLNELEMLNLAEQVKMPVRLSTAVDELIEESKAAELRGARSVATVPDAMDVLYEIQDSLMFNQIEDE